jgi:purine-binding chemotaxis protein CheW
VTAGLLVDSINQVIRLASDRVEPPPAVLSGVDRSLVDGVGRYQGRMIILLSLASVLDVGMA